MTREWRAPKNNTSVSKKECLLAAEETARLLSHVPESLSGCTEFPKSIRNIQGERGCPEVHRNAHRTEHNPLSRRISSVPNSKGGRKDGTKAARMDSRSVP